MDTRCSKCGSSKTIPMASVVDQGDNSDGSLKACVGYTNPEAWIFKGAVYARLKATICGECGFTELSVEDPAAVYETYLKTRT